MLKQIKQYMDQNHMVSQGDRIVLGVSGGADSVCLFMLLQELSKEYDLSLFVVHINHMMRKEAASADQEFVENLCKRFSLPCFVYQKPIEEWAREHKISCEEAGRLYRYECFEEVRQKVMANHIAVAHNKNDQAETILFHLIRGCSITGLIGIKPVRDNIIRPLLDTSREEIEEFLKSKGEVYQTDATNLAPIYSRNKIRLNLLPVMKEMNALAAEHICEIGVFANETMDYINKQVLVSYELLVHKKENELWGDVKGIKELHPLIQKELIKKLLTFFIHGGKNLTSTHIKDVQALLLKETGRQINLPYGLVAVKDYNNLRVYKEEKKYKIDQGFDYQLELNTSFHLPNPFAVIQTKVTTHDSGIEISKKTYTKVFDYDKIKDTLHIRSRQAGDFIQIKKNNGNKSLKKFFIDEKVPKHLRAQIPLLTLGQEVIWIIGYRMNEYYKVTDETKNILEVSVQWKDEGDEQP